jgi:transcriptional regulator with XRE-family HTH domain
MSYTRWAMMSIDELRQILLRLGLSQTEAAQILGVTPRTIRRWLEGEEISGPAAQALRAWIRLHERNLPWRPDSASIADDDQDQIARHRMHTINLSEILGRVEARGGPRLPWTVDRQRSCATLGPMEVSYYTLLNGGFSLATYTRKDGDPDVQRDWELIEDAMFCIAKALEPGPVTLVYHDRPWRKGTVQQTFEEFASTNEAIQRACAAMGSPNFNDPFIMAGNPAEPLLDKQELRRECERRKSSAAAVRAIAEYVERNSAMSVTSGARMLNATQATEKHQRIDGLAQEIRSLATTAEQGLAGYHQFDVILGKLHKLGFFPETVLVSEVARAFLRT